MVRGPFQQTECGKKPCSQISYTGYSTSFSTPVENFFHTVVKKCSVILHNLHIIMSA